jgi:predicted permease
MAHAAIERHLPMWSVLDTLIPVFLLIALGAAVTHWRLLTREGWSGVETLTYHVLIPAFMIATLARADLGGAVIAASGIVLAGCVLAMAALLTILQPVLARAWGVNGPAYTSLFQGACRWNSFAALAIAGTLYGTVGATVAAMAVIAMVPLLNFLCVVVLVKHAGGRAMTPGRFIVTLLGNPFIWGALAGIAVNLLALPLPSFVTMTLDMMARATLAVTLLMVGGGLDLATAGKVDRPIALALGLKLLLMPAFALAGAWAFGLSGAALGAVVLCAAVPTASASYVLARQMGGDAELMARIITVQTLASMVCLPIWLLAVA